MAFDAELRQASLGDPFSCVYGSEGRSENRIPRQESPVARQSTILLWKA